MADESEQQDEDHHGILPSYCHSASKTFHRWCPLRARDVAALREVRGFEGQNIYFHKNHPIKWIKLVGIIVDIAEFPAFKADGNGRWVATVDDACGRNMELVCATLPRRESTFTELSGAKTHEEEKEKEGNAKQKQGEGEKEDGKRIISPDGMDLTDLEIGTVIKAKGGIATYRGTRQMTLRRVEIIRDTNDEVKAWSEIVRFRKEVLSSYWVMTREEQQKCLDEERKAQEEEIREAARIRREQEHAEKRRVRKLMKVKEKEAAEKQRAEDEKTERRRRRKEKEERNRLQQEKQALREELVRKHRVLQKQAAEEKAQREVQDKMQWQQYARRKQRELLEQAAVEKQARDGQLPVSKSVETDARRS